MADVNSNKRRVIKVLQIHRDRLATYSGKEPDEVGDQIARVLLRYFDRIGLLDKIENSSDADLSRRLGKSPQTRYPKEHPNAALRKLCDMAAEEAKDSGSGYTLMIIPEELLEVHVLSCATCGTRSLAKRTTRKTCRDACKSSKYRSSRVSK